MKLFKQPAFPELADLPPEERDRLLSAADLVTPPLFNWKLVAMGLAIFLHVAIGAHFYAQFLKMDRPWWEDVLFPLGWQLPMILLCAFLLNKMQREHERKHLIKYMRFWEEARRMEAQPR